jgi:hypothetical protein
MSFLFLALLMALPAFPTCQGFGCPSVGGSGRNLTPPQSTTYVVSTLADSGTGSLRACVEASGPRTCVFEVGGYIDTQSYLKVDNPFITIAGQTSPGGVTLRGCNVMVRTHDVIIRHLKIRNTDTPNDNCPPGNRRPLGIYADGPQGPAANVVLDHLSLSWAIDELFDTWYTGIRDVSLTSSILSEALYDSVHPQGPQSTAILLGEGTERISFVRNLLAHAFSRNPYDKAGVSAELVNNVIYHWGYGKGGHDGSWAMMDLSDYDHTGKKSFYDILGNAWKCGTDSECRFAPVFSSPGVDALNVESKIYAKGNTGPGRPTDSGDEWLITNGLPKPQVCTSARVFKDSTVQAVSTTQAFNEVLRDAGAFPKERDVVDARIVAETQMGQGSFKNCVVDDGSPRCAGSLNAGGWPQLKAHTRKLALPADPNGVDPRGYTNLELWLETYPVAFTPPNPTPTPTPGPLPSPTATVTPNPSYPPCP